MLSLDVKEYKKEQTYKNGDRKKDAKIQEQTKESVNASIRKVYVKTGQTDIINEK